MIIRMLQRLKNAAASFFRDRYGLDNLGNFLTALFFILWLLLIFTGNILVGAAELAVLFWMWFRILSRNKEKRWRENQKYLKIKGKIKSFFTFGRKGNDSSLKKEKKRYRKTHVFVKCPGCKNNLRLPRVKGRHTVRCPVCSKSFDVKI